MDISFWSLSVFISDDSNAAAVAAGGDDGTVYIEWKFILQGLIAQCDYVTCYIIHMNLLHWFTQ